MGSTPFIVEISLPSVGSLFPFSFATVWRFSRKCGQKAEVNESEVLLCADVQNCQIFILWVS